MATNTDNFKLIKPGQDEFYDVGVSNANMDTIDGILKTLQDAINSGATEQELAQIRQELATHLADEVKHVTQAEKDKIAGSLQKTGGIVTGDIVFDITAGEKQLRFSKNGVGNTYLYGVDGRTGI